MTRFIERHPLWSFVILIAIAAALWLIFATWPQGLEDAFGRKKVFLNAVFNGITLGGLYFLVASGFTLIFGLMRNVNLAHGSLYLFGGYVGYAVSVATGSWILSFVAAFIVVALVGVAMQILVFRRIGGSGSAPDHGHDRIVDRVRRPDAVGLRRRFLSDPDAERAGWPDRPCRSSPPSSPPARRSICQYPMVRLVIFAASVVIGVAMWLALNRTRIGMIVRAGVDDRDILAAMGVRIQLVFVLVFALGAGLAGMAGVVGGTFQSISPGEDTRFLLASLVVVIIGGMGSIPGAALGALIVGLAEQLGSVYIPTYAIVVTFLIMVLVLAIRPQGLLAGR